VQMGGCYEKLGRAEARKAYERVVRDYADQPETVAQARARLSKLSSADNKTASAISTRRVWARAGDAYAPSPDGRYLSYINWTTVELAVHDLKTGENRDLTDEGTWNKASEYPDRSIWSPDSRQVAYCRFEAPRSLRQRSRRRARSLASRLVTGRQVHPGAPGKERRKPGTGPRRSHCIGLGRGWVSARSQISGGPTYPIHEPLSGRAICGF
jgi:hypothetical protein